MSLTVKARSFAFNRQFFTPAVMSRHGDHNNIDGNRVAKFTTDYVNLIANNLRDRYKTGFPILKELLQNADDAGAKLLSFGYHQGLAGQAIHELLQGPALWVMNDGRFEKKDQQAIRSFGLNSKAAESGAIGKFGLGMKSVFHLCEAFFYLASDGSVRFHEILSPWFQEADSHDKHVAWENLHPDDLKALYDIAVMENPSSSDQSQSWFMLWIPLRRRTHVPSLNGIATAPIIERYPGDDAGRDLDFFTEPGVDKRVGKVLPLLRNLQRVRFSGTPLLSAFDLRLEVAGDGKRLDHLGDAKISGTVLDGGPKSEYLHFMAIQTLRSGAEPFSMLQAATAWPKSNAIVAQGNRSPVPDKAQPEGAVAISHGDGRRGHLSIQWAVYLPTEEQRFRYEAQIPNSSREFEIALHGQFFVDSGRRGIEGMDRLEDTVHHLANDASETKVQLAWNRALAQDIVLPMVLPAIAEYVRSEGFGDEQIAALTDAFSRCTAPGEAGNGKSFSSKFAAHLHRDHVWVRVLRRTGASWELQPADLTMMRLLPRPVDSDRERPWRVMPGLANFVDAIFVDATAPRISHTIRHWDQEDVCLAVDQLPSATLCSETALKYLIEFLSMHSNIALNTERVRSHLVVQIRRALRDCSLAELRAQRQLFRQLIALLPREHWYAVGTRTTDAKGALSEAFYKNLFAVDTNALLIPADLAPDGEPGAPSIADLEAWLCSVGSMAKKKIEVTRCLETAEGLLATAGTDSDGQASMVRRHPHLPVLRALDGRGGDDVACSLHELLEAHADGRVFRIADAKERLGLTPDLARAVPSLQLFVLGKAARYYVQSATPSGNPELPPASSAAAMFHCLGVQVVVPELNSSESRVRLLNHVGSLNDFTDPAVLRGVRYLLHGQASHFHSMVRLWKDPSTQNSPWVKLWRMIAEDTWSVLPSDLSEPLTDRCSKYLNIQPVDKSTVTARLKLQDSFTGVDAAAFRHSERDEILGHLEDETAWRRLPLHLDTRGNFGPADSACHLGDQPQLPLGLATSQRFIVESKNDAHQRLQTRYLQRWSADFAAQEILRSDTSARYWRYLMDWLPAASRYEQATVKWREVPWLPLRSGGSISPSSLAHLDALGTEIGGLAEACGYAYAGVADLSDEVRTHTSFDLLLGLIPSGGPALAVLGLLMNDSCISIGSNGIELGRHLDRHLASLSGIKALPAWALVAKAVSATSIKDVEIHLLPNIAIPLARATAECVLAELSSPSASTSSREVFLAYVSEWEASASSAELRQHLPTLCLPAMDGSWHPSTELAHGVFGVTASCLVNSEVAQILQHTILSNATIADTVERSAVKENNGAAGAELELALERWSEPAVQSSIRPAIGAVMSMFGIEARALAERTMSPISYDDFLVKLNWKDPGYEEGLTRRVKWMGDNADPKRPFTLLKPVFVEEVESFVSGKSLTGAELKLPLSQGDALSTLVAGPVRWLGGYGAEIRLRELRCLESFDNGRKNTVLQTTAEQLLVSLYNQGHANLTELWDLFDEADQIELDLARTLVLDGLPQLISQLPSVKHHPAISAVLATFDKARREIASAECAKLPSEAPRERKHEALQKLEQLVRTDVSVQHAVLNAIRKKVERYQYEPSSIPFELLQNADDAVGEYQAMQLAEGRQRFAPDEICRFVATRTTQSLVFIHWGRPITYAGKRNGYKSDYEQDLERMLMLGASAKELDGEVTGKFGLGFKSVLLATDSPVIESGDVRFEIVAGCLPRQAQTSSSAKEIVAQHRRGNMRPTVVELPMTNIPNTLMRRFDVLAGLCTVFSRRIRHIAVDTQTHAWRPERLLEAGTAWCELGQVQVPCKNGLVPTRLLVLRCEHGDAAIRVDGGPVPFDREAVHPVPTIWVRSPTRGTAATGLVLNADFEVDTGRGSLPQGKAAQRNLALATRLATELAPLLAQLIRNSRADWKTWSARLGADPRMQSAAFWYAFWSTALPVETDANASQDAVIAEAQALRLFNDVVDQTGIIPNGLPGELGEFCDICDISLAVRYERLQQVLPVLLQWPAFVEMFPPRSWCRFEVRSWLDARPEPNNEAVVEELDRSVLLRVLGPQRRLRAEDIVALAAVVNAWPQGPTEAQGWRNEFASILLQSRAGNWKPMGALFAFGGELGNPLTLIVPDDALLDLAYEKKTGDWLALLPYLAKKTLLPDDMASWCIEASAEPGQLAVLDWLASNLDYVSVWSAIRNRKRADIWLFELHTDHSLLAATPPEDRALLLARLGLITVSGEDQPEMPPVPAAALDLKLVHDWWIGNRHIFLPSYDDALWPQRIDRAMLAADETDRDTWMTLFSLGIFKRFGRVKEEQNRAFLEFLHDRGWWETISQVNPAQEPERWMGILSEYAEANQVSGIFEQWMDTFPRLYRLARWFDQYVELFRGLQYRSEQETLRLLTPATDYSLSGTGFDAPTLHRTLRVGHCLVVRELLRAGVLQSESARSMAFMTGSSVVDFLMGMGYPKIDSSQEIYQLLFTELGDAELASFGGDYDIPLIILSRDRALQQDVYNWGQINRNRADWDDEEAA